MEQLDPPGPALSATGRFERVDRLLRQLATVQDQTTTERISTRDLLAVAIACAAIYGLSMGLFAATTRGSGGLAQMIASAIKVPLLFGMTIAVTFPSFYVICAVAGMETSAGRLLRMLLFGVAIASAILASLAPVVAFFTLSTDSHAFMVLLSVGFFAIATLLGLRTIRARAGLVFAADERRRPMGLGMLRL